MEQNSTETHVLPSDRANETAAAACQQQLLMSRPPGEIPVFNGDLPPHKTFIRASEHGLKSTNKAECLYFLEQFSVSTCLLVEMTNWLKSLWNLTQD